MGNCFSDPSAKKGFKGQGQQLGSAPPPKPAAIPAPQPVAHQAPLASPSRGIPQTGGRMLGDGYEDSNRTNDARAMAAQAAQDRMASQNKRGVIAGGGKLQAKLEADRKKPLYGNEDNEPSPMDARNYN